MANDSLSDSSTKFEALPKLNLFTMFRLGLFQMGLGIMSLLTLGLLNRVMIDELAIPATIAAGAIAMNQFVSPTRVWFGQLSDAKPLFGSHRTGYVWIGTALFTLIAFLAVQIVWQVGIAFQPPFTWSWATSAWIGGLGIVFACYGVALSASSTPFAALLVDISDDDNRSKLVGIVWSMLMIGIVIGAILTGKLLEPIKLDAPQAIIQASINRIFMVVPAIVFGLAMVATAGVEKKYSRYASRSVLVDREDQITLGRALKILTASRQTGLFFVFLLVMTLSLFFQEPVLEPFGGEIFQMTIAETTRLNAPYGIGTLLGIATAGFLIVPRLGKKRTTKLGCLFVAFTFIGLILTGFTANPNLLKGIVFLFGMASGITTNGALTLMLDLTAAETAGTFIGAWGLSQALARASATVTGGAVLDLGRKLFENPVLAYGLVFIMPIIGMTCAIFLLDRVNVKEFQSDAKAAIARVLESELD